MIVGQLGAEQFGALYLKLCSAHFWNKITRHISFSLFQYQVFELCKINHYCHATFHSIIAQMFYRTRIKIIDKNANILHKWIEKGFYNENSSVYS